MMHGHGKSDPAIVAGKPANKVEPSTAEPVEPRAGTEGNMPYVIDAATEGATGPGIDKIECEWRVDGKRRM